MTAISTHPKPHPAKYTTNFLLYSPALWRNAIGSDFAQEHLGLQEQGTGYVMYLSIPFCRMRCHSCPYFVDLLSIHDAKAQNKEERYVEALLADLELWVPLFPVHHRPAARDLHRRWYRLHPVGCQPEARHRHGDHEVPAAGGLRADPGRQRPRLDGAKLDYVADSPITRISLGVQSFDPTILKIIGLPHGTEKSATTINEFHRRDFRNMQMDMMYNMPGHTHQI